MANKLCQYCSCKLLMDIEIQHKCCWDCHYEGKDMEEKIPPVKMKPFEFIKTDEPKKQNNHV